MRNCLQLAHSVLGSLIPDLVRPKPVIFHTLDGSLSGEEVKEMAHSGNIKAMVVLFNLVIYAHSEVGLGKMWF